MLCDHCIHIDNINYVILMAPTPTKHAHKKEKSNNIGSQCNPDMLL